MNDREFDVVVYGATGFTGQLVAEYLLGQYGQDKGLRWAIAGRSEEKLRRMRRELGPAAEHLPIIVADSADADALGELASRTRVVLTTVGPYALYGSNLVAACVEHATDYCDLAGETQWVRKMIDTHHERAQETGARIVHCCGFDSIPMDIGVYFLQEEAKARHGAYCESIALYVKATKGSMSGGTMASMSNIIQEAQRDRTIARILADPYALNPPGERQGPDGADQKDVRFDEDVNSWTAPFVMAAINTRVVRRSNALAGYPYGRGFRYREATLTGPGTGGRLKGAMLAAALGALVLGISAKPTRALLQKFFLPEPGEGPSRDQQKSGFFSLMQVGKLPDGKIMRTRIAGDRDPGYGSTSKMLSESAVCLAKDELATGGGVWTPASAMGAPLLVRLRRNAGLTFEVIG